MLATSLAIALTAAKVQPLNWPIAFAALIFFMPVGL